MTMNDWRRRLLRLQQAERQARAALVPGMDPLSAERAYEALREIQREIEAHYRIRPPGN